MDFLRRALNGLSSGMGVGIGIALILGIYFIVRAVAPGTVTNPTFGPTDDDVELTPSTTFLNTRPLVFFSNTCADGTNNVWKILDFSSYIPTTAKYVFIRARCEENRVTIRPVGSAVAPLDTGYVSCNAGDNSTDINHFDIEPVTSRQFEMYNTGTDCGTRLMHIWLLGYST